MTSLKITRPEDASDDLADLYQTLTEKIGFVPNGFQMLGISVDVLKKQSDHMDWVMQHPSLSPQFATVLRLLVSKNRSCNYCIDANSAMLQNYFDVTAEQIDALKLDPENAPLEDREKALLKFVLNTVENAQSATESQLYDLKNHGWADHEIMDALYQGAQQVAVDILFDAFNVESDTMLTAQEK